MKQMHAALQHAVSLNRKGTAAHLCASQRDGSKSLPHHARVLDPYCSHTQSCPVTVRDTLQMGTVSQSTVMCKTIRCGTLGVNA